MQLFVEHHATHAFAACVALNVPTGTQSCQVALPMPAWWVTAGPPSHGPPLEELEDPPDDELLEEPPLDEPDDDEVVPDEPELPELEVPASSGAEPASVSFTAACPSPASRLASGLEVSGPASAASVAV